ncbi:MAG: glycosyltransferase family 9 protein [Cetobacterium sp.]|uniref:glycosyltransferase family 9 protein n=1 Tax=Cetobacterium sp. TaxID=2071632 RepID=UPI002FC91041
MRILIIHTAFIGDIVLSTPLIRKIKDIYPESKITYVTTPVGAQILRNNPDISEIIEYDKRKAHSGINGIFQLGKRLRYENFNMVISLHRYLRSSVLSWLTRAPIRLGYDVASGSFLFTKKIKYDKKLHEVEKILSFIEGGKPAKDYKIELYPGDEDIKKVDKFWEEKNLSNKKVIVIAPGSRWFTKKWPLDYFNQVIKELEKKENIAVIIVGGADEKGLNIVYSDSTIDLRGCTTLLGLAEVLKRADIVLTNDSSPIHIASAWEKPHILAIFGPTIKEFGFTPWSTNSEVLQIENLDCRPCSIHGGDKCPKGHFKCMMDITPEKVLDKLC